MLGFTVIHSTWPTDDRYSQPWCQSLYATRMWCSYRKICFDANAAIFSRDLKVTECLPQQTVWHQSKEYNTEGLCLLFLLPDFDAKSCYHVPNVQKMIFLNYLPSNRRTTSLKRIFPSWLMVCGLWSQRSTTCPTPHPRNCSFFLYNHHRYFKTSGAHL